MAITLNVFIGQQKINVLSSMLYLDCLEVEVVVFVVSLTEVVG